MYSNLLILKLAIRAYKNGQHAQKVYAELTTF